MLRIKSIDKLILGYFSIYFLVSMMLFISIFLLFSFLQIINSRDIIKGGSLVLLLKSIIYLIPSIITTSAMFSYVFSVFFTVGDMSTRGEIGALRCSGYSYKRIAEKIVLLSLLMIPFLYFLNHSIVPTSKIKSRQALRSMINRVTNINLKSGLFEKISSSKIIAHHTSPSSLTEINIIRENIKELTPNKKANFIVDISANNGTYIKLKEKGILFSLNNGKILLTDTTKPHLFYIGSFSNYQTFIPFEINEKKYDLNPKFMTTKQIKENIKNKTVLDTEKAKKEILSRTASSVAILPLTLLSLILAFFYERESKYFSFAASIGTIFSILCLSDNIRLSVFKKNYQYTSDIVFTFTFYFSCWNLFLY